VHSTIRYELLIDFTRVLEVLEYWAYISYAKVHFMVLIPSRDSDIH